MGSWIGYADIVKLSAEDLAWTFPDLTVAEAARRWRAAGATVVVVTRGADGVYADGPAGVIELATPSVAVVDTVGAGDTFMAGLLAELSHRDLLSRPRLSTLTSADLTGGSGSRNEWRRSHANEWARTRRDCPNWSATNPPHGEVSAGERLVTNV